MHAEHTSEVSALAHILEDLVGHLLRFVPFGYVGHEFLLDPLADLIAEGYVGIVVVGRVVLDLVLAMPMRHVQADILFGTMMGLRMG